jgi:F-type H+-transporting ATPase subunit delta
VASDLGNVSGLAERYATALFELAQDDHQLDQVAKDLDSLRKLIDSSDDLKRLVRSPVFSRDDQANAMGAILDRAGVHALTRRFVLFVASQRRLFALQDMARSFAKQLADMRGEMTARVTSAKQLSTTQVAALKATLKSAFGGRDVALDTQVDPSLLGGIVVKVGSRMIDSSLKTKLNNLAHAMKGA